MTAVPSPVLTIAGKWLLSLMNTDCNEPGRHWQGRRSACLAETRRLAPDMRMFPLEQVSGMMPWLAVNGLLGVVFGLAPPSAHGQQRLLWVSVNQPPAT